MKKLSFKRVVLVSMSICILLLTACGKNRQITRAEDFINMQISYETYKDVTDEETLKQKFMEYMTDEAYESYKRNYFLSLYPGFYARKNAKGTEIKKIKCKETKKESDGSKTYIFEVKYAVKCKSKDINMKDNISLTINSENQITTAIVMNTSDMVKKMILDIKVQ